MFTEAYLEPSQTSTMELFSFPLNHILKTLNLIELPLGSIFYAKLCIFCEKTYNCQNFGRKIILLTIEEYFFFKI